MGASSSLVLRLGGLAFLAWVGVPTLGCASAPASTTPPDVSASSVSSARERTTGRALPVDHLDGKAGDRTGLRAWVQRSTEIVFREGAEPIAKMPSQGIRPIEAIVVEQRGQNLRVVLEGHDVRLLVLVPPDSLALVTKKPVRLAWGRDEAPPEVDGVRLAPGVPLEEIAFSHDRIRVKGIADDVAFEGWIDGDATDRAFVHGRFDGGDPDGLVREGADLLDVNGKIIVRVPTFGGHELVVPVVTVPGAPAGLVRVIFTGPSIEVRGLVHAADWKARDPGDGLSLHGSGWGDGGGMSDTPTAQIVAGASLFDADGAVVGKMKSEETVYLQARPVKNDATRIRAWVHMTSLGFVTVYVQPDDLRPR
jgi:hypothetical protein